MSKKYEGRVKIVECREGEPICCGESSDPDGPFCYFYTIFFKKVFLRLPLPIFEKELLSELNVALPSYVQIVGHSSELLLFCVHSWHLTTCGSFSLFLRG